MRWVQTWYAVVSGLAMLGASFSFWMPSVEKTDPTWPAVAMFMLGLAAYLMLCKIDHTLSEICERVGRRPATDVESPRRFS